MAHNPPATVLRHVRVLRKMRMIKLEIAVVFLLAECVVAAGARLPASQPPSETQPHAKRQDGPRPVPKAVDQPAADGDALVRTDGYGDPLPPRAVARVGTVRWWSGRSNACPLVYTPDGKSLVCCDSRKAIVFLDTATGKERRRIQRRGDEIYCFALSPDGKTVVTAGLRSRVLRIWDVATGKELRQIPVGKEGAGAVAFSPNGKVFAAVTEQVVIRLWDVGTWRETRRLTGHEGFISSVVFLPDGKTLVCGGGTCRSIRWWDVGTGREVRRLDKRLGGNRRLALSPDGKRLAAIVSSVDKARWLDVLYLWNAATGEEVSRTDLSKKGGNFCLCFSPDSQTLACRNAVGHPGNHTLFFAAATGRELRRWDENSYTTQLAYSPDGKVLAQAECGVIRLRDAATGKLALQMPTLPGYVMAVAFAPGGKRLIASCFGGDTGFWEPLTGPQLVPLQGPPKGFAGHPDMLLGTALTADGKKAALVDAKGVLHVWGPATGKVWCRIGEPPVGRDQADFSPDGKVLVVKHQDDVIRLWDAETGKPRWALPGFGHAHFPHAHAFSPDGRVLATAPELQDKNVIRLWDTTTGKQVGRLACQDSSYPSCLLFSADGKHLIAAPSGYPDVGAAAAQVAGEKSLRVWDLARGRELRRFPTPAEDIRSMAISPDGKTLAAAAYDTILLWELASGKERGRFAGHRHWVWSVAFSPDGRLLASGSLDYTALVWDVTGMWPDGKWSSRGLRPGEIERLWADLGGADGIRAYRAMWTMVAGGRQSVRFLAEHVRAVAPLDEPRAARLIADLDSKQFSARGRASEELEQLGQLAEPALCRALAGKPSLEVRRRLQTLLERAENRTLSSAQLRSVRAVEVLENLGTTGAQHVLEAVSKGAPAARLTQEAKASLRRLATRADAKP